MVSNAKTVAIPTSVNGLGFKNLEHIDRFNEITEKVQKITVLAQRIFKLAVLKHLESGEVSGAVPYMSHLFMVQCFLVCTQGCFSGDSRAYDNTREMRKIVIDVWNEYSERLSVNKIDLPYANSFATYFRTAHKAAIVSTIKKHYYNLLFDTVHKLSGFDNDIKAIELAFKNGAISKTVYDEQISDRKKVHKALREYTTNVLPKDVVDTGADAGLHPDLVRVLSTYSPGFARIGGTINDSIDRHPDDHLWAMLRLNEVRGKHNMSTINILPSSSRFKPTYVRFDMTTIYEVILFASERHTIYQAEVWNSYSCEEQLQLPHACNDCPMRFQAKTPLNIHRKVAHYTVQEFPFKCATCGMPFPKKSALTTHNSDTCNDRRWI